MWPTGSKVENHAPVMIWKHFSFNQQLGLLCTKICNICRVFSVELWPVWWRMRVLIPASAFRNVANLFRNDYGYNISNVHFDRNRFQLSQFLLQISAGYILSSFFRQFLLRIIKILFVNLGFMARVRSVTLQTHNPFHSGSFGFRIVVTCRSFDTSVQEV